jgi:FKBP-type peptidyl-prolyl cis-trans isomerase (trigger factor)
MRKTDKDKFFAEEVVPVAKKRLERSLILDEIVRMEKIEVKKEELDAEFNDTLNDLTQQGLDLGKIRGGKQGQQRLAETVAMESASRVLIRHALDTLKAIAIGEYKPKDESAEIAEIKKKPKAPKKAKKAESASKSKKEAGSSSTKKKSPVKKAPAKKPAAKK